MNLLYSRSTAAKTSASSDLAGTLAFRPPKRETSLCVGNISPPDWCLTALEGMRADIVCASILLQIQQKYCLTHLF
jgi:hypothetical protein